MLASVLLAGCAAVTPPAAPVRTSLKPSMFSVTQVGNGSSVRYVFCEADSCPTPTEKTPVTHQSSTSLAAPVPASRSAAMALDVSFPFNSSHVSDGDRNALSAASAARRGNHVEIIARSDFVGPRPGQQKVIAARAKAMRSILATKTQDVQITERHEVAGPQPVAESEQARQRRGTVRFIPPIDVVMKGKSK